MVTVADPATSGVKKIDLGEWLCGREHASWPGQEGTSGMKGQDETIVRQMGRS